MEVASVKFVLIAWMLSVSDGKLHYFMPIMVMQDLPTCEKALADLKETHQRGYAFNLAIKGACIPANAGG
jgi:hypothetical protein